MEGTHVSVVITTHKRRVEQIGRAIDSVLNQSYKNLELIIVDDSPEEYEYRREVRQYCESIADPRVTYIQHEANRGACVARNTGLTASKGEYIAFLDDDDEWAENKISRQLEVFKNRDATGNLGLVYCNACFHDAYGGTRQFFDTSKPCRGSVYKELSCCNFIGSTSFPLLRKEALEAVGGFDPEMVASQDWDVWLRISRDYSVDYIDEPLVHYYIHTGERITGNAFKRLQALHRLDEKQKELLSEDKDVLAARREVELRLYIQSMQVGEALRCYLEIIAARPGRVLKNIVLLKAFGRLVIKRRKGTY